MRHFAVTVLLLTAALAGCSKAPKGVDSAALDDAISKVIGDPSTCVLVVKKGSGDVVYRYGSHMTCGVSLPTCQGVGGQTTANDLAKAAAGGETRTASCGSPAGGAAFAIGPLPTQKPENQSLAYAAVMNSKRMLPGMEMASRLEGAFAKGGL